MSPIICRWLTWLARMMTAAIILTACESNGTVEPPSTIPSSTGSTAETSKTSDPTTTSAPEEEESVDRLLNASVFIATIEAAMQGTAYERAVLEEPEVFLATAQLMCELLDAGIPPDQILGEYLDGFAAEGAANPTDEEVLITGVLLGSAVEVICPEHSDSL